MAHPFAVVRFSSGIESSRGCRDRGKWWFRPPARLRRHHVGRGGVRAHLAGLGPAGSSACLAPQGHGFLPLLSALLHLVAAQRLTLTTKVGTALQHPRSGKRTFGAKNGGWVRNDSKKSKVLRSGAVMRLRAARRTETAVLLPQTRLGTKGLRAVVQPSPAKRDCRSDIVRPASARLLAWLGGRCRRPLNTSVVEDINNTIKVIKRRANGYGDEKYLFLKIRAAFPGNPRGARNLPVSPCNSYTPISTGSLNAQHSTDCYEPTR